jgi:hypothetical protein
VVGLKAPDPPETDHVTVPCGVLVVPPAVSVTVALHEVDTFMDSEAGGAGEQMMLTEVVRNVTVTAVVPLLALCTVSGAPGVYSAVSVCVPPLMAVGK